MSAIDALQRESSASHADAFARRQEKRIADLEAFKRFVHERLDKMGVPPEFPNGVHTKEGCRIGDRLDAVEDAIAEYRLTFEVMVRERDASQPLIEAVRRWRGGTVTQVAELADALSTYERRNEPQFVPHAGSPTLADEGYDANGSPVA